MSLSRAEVEHIADLARLELSGEELERFREQLSAILDYAARLQAVDTSQDNPIAGSLLDAGTALVLGEAPLRADEPSSGLPPADLLRGAPRVEDQQFRVPPVLE